jgi:multiple antibiotic resistance protein
LFIAVNPISLIPIFAGLTSGLTKQQVKTIYIRASVVSLIVLSTFWLFGNAILDAMNISMDSFRIIGGLFLVVIAFQMVFEQRQTRRQNTADTAVDDETIKSIAIFPLSIPLIAGPGAMATSLLLSKESYLNITDAAISYLPIFIVVLLAGLAMWLSAKLSSKLGPTIITVVEKIFGLLLGALAIEFVIEGIRNSFNL